MADMQFTNMITDMFKNLDSEMLLLDEHGTTIPEGTAYQVPEFEENAAVAVSEGLTWGKIKAEPVYYVAAKGTDGHAADCVKLAVAWVNSCSTSTSLNGQLDVYRGALCQELSGPELDTLAVEYGIENNMERCVLLFYGSNLSLEDLLPMEKGDLLISMDRHSNVLIKNMRTIADHDEMMQLAEAMEHTIMSETGEQPLIGIGETRNTLEGLGISYRTAKEALEIGRLFEPDKNIFAYDRMILERYLNEMPRDVGMKYHHILFNRKTQRLFNEEMMRTIEMFFEKDLNLSDTARQLYIHRNTLVYRLDKVQKQIGLDLRHFDDAITFCVLMKLGKYATER